MSWIGFVAIAASWNEKAAPSAVGLYYASVRNSTGKNFHIDVLRDGEWIHDQFVASSRGVTVRANSPSIGVRICAEESGYKWHGDHWTMDAVPVEHSVILQYELVDDVDGRIYIRKVVTSETSAKGSSQSTSPPGLATKSDIQIQEDDADLRATFPTNTPAWSEQRQQGAAMGALFYVRIENGLDVPIQLKYVTHSGKIEEFNIAAHSTRGMGCGDPSTAYLKFAGSPDRKLRPNLPLWKLETKYLDHIPNSKADQVGVPLYRLMEAVPGEVACILVKK